MVNQQAQPATPAEWHERIRAKAAGFRVWLEDGRGCTGTLRNLDSVLSDPDLVCHLVGDDFKKYEQWLSTFWDMTPEQQGMELDLWNRVAQAQNTKDYLDSWTGA